MAKSAFFYLELDNRLDIRQRLEAKDFDDKRERLRELFVFGRGLKNNDDLRENIVGVSSECIRIYNQSVFKIQDALLCFFLICKQQNWLSRDTRRMIGQMIWESRTDPYLWNVELIEKGQ